MHVPPRGLLQGLPVAEGFEPKIEQPFRFAFLLGDEADNVFVQTFVDDFGLHVGGKAVFVFLLGGFAHEFVFFFHI